jgi:NADH-quinone oxidoreductase subunit E
LAKLTDKTMSASNSLLNEHSRHEIDDWIKRYPAEQKQSAVLAALRVAQHQNNGYLTTALMDAVAEYLSMDKIAVYEVASFYSMYELKPVARHNIAICTNVCCMLMGSDTIVNHLEKKLGIKLGESTADGRIYLKKEEECLAACAGGPMMQVNHKYYTELTPQKVDEIIDSLE